MLNHHDLMNSIPLSITVFINQTSFHAFHSTLEFDKFIRKKKKKEKKTSNFKTLSTSYYMVKAYVLYLIKQQSK